MNIVIVRALVVQNAKKIVNEVVRARGEMCCVLLIVNVALVLSLAEIRYIIYQNFFVVSLNVPESICVKLVRYKYFISSAGRRTKHSIGNDKSSRHRWY